MILLSYWSVVNDDSCIPLTLPCIAGRGERVIGMRGIVAEALRLLTEASEETSRVTLIAEARVCFSET